MDHDSQRLELIGMVGSKLYQDMSGDRGSLRLASQQAHERVLAFERSAQAAWTPATGGMPDTPKLVPGDNLLVVSRKTRYRPEFVQDAEVDTMARFKIHLKWTNLETHRPDSAFFDVRTRRVWTTGRDADRMYRGGGLEFFTREQWAYELRARLADAYLKERGIYPSSVRGPLSGLLHNDVVGFANALRRLEGLVEL